MDIMTINKKYIIKKIVYADSVKDSIKKEREGEIIEIVFDNWEKKEILGFKK